MALQTHSSQDVTVEQAFAERDWASTPLGPRAQWPESLKTALSIAMQSRFPIIIFWGLDLVQLYNQAYRPILGDKHPRALGQTARDCFPEIWDSIGPMLHGVLESGRATWSEDLMLPLVRDGHPGEYYFTFSYSPITDATGVAGVFCAVQETTAAVVARRDAERRTRELVELNRAKDTFLTNISHEFRTPLALMLAPLAQAATAIGDGPARSDIDVATRNALRLQRLVDSLLAYSRIEAGRLEPRFVRVDLCEFTRDLVASFESLAAEAGLALSIACESHADVAVDRDMWERIVFNLMSNAIKYTLDGRIDVSVHVDDATVTLSVRDTGIGIKPEHRERIFERFYRAHTEGRSAEGAGIGLALTRDLVHLHGGTIDVEDAPGGGSIFTVRIPRRNGVHAVAVEDETTTSSAPQYLAEAAGWLDAAPMLDASS
ncbi:MAG TPA: HAMP domain-containing sensor histidine kinase, partial [Candidatus Aquilonibacter sp.]|nr:HAMP domain-containing sensor histidine kinase [Candidatus Aquilonibacter sp.]